MAESTIPAQEKLRREKIKAREGLTPIEREQNNRAIARQILAYPGFQNAKTIMLYRAVRGEVDIAEIEKAAEAAEKRLAFPLCVDKGLMIALTPEDSRAWHKGSFGIMEPDMEHSRLTSPEEIDLVICPCTVFDEACRRIGMGGGYYDRFLPLCTSAKIIAVAFEKQKTERIPESEWDIPMDAVATEKKIYRRNTQLLSNNT